MPYGSTIEPIIDYAVMFLTSSEMEQDLIQTHQNMECEILHHQWKCYRKEY